MLSRRTFLRSLATAGSVATITGLYAWQIEPFWLEFTDIKMPVRHLPDALVGKTIMQISDIHIGTRFDPEFIRKSFIEAKKYEPDFVVYTGDFINHGHNYDYEPFRSVMKDAVKGRLGTFGVLGNHDYGHAWSEIAVAEKVNNYLKESGVQVLRNEKVETAGLYFIGWDDVWSPHKNPAKAMQHYQPEQPTIVLCHNPDAADFPEWRDYRGWILSGHTHGGQCKPPFLPAPFVPVSNRRYTRGQIDLEDGRTVYINRALGHLWQVRFNVRPEITIFTLEKT